MLFFGSSPSSRCTSARKAVPNANWNQIGLGRQLMVPTLPVTQMVMREFSIQQAIQSTALIGMRDMLGWHHSVTSVGRLTTYALPARTAETHPYSRLSRMRLYGGFMSASVVMTAYAPSRRLDGNQEPVQAGMPTSGVDTQHGVGMVDVRRSLSQICGHCCMTRASCANQLRACKNRCTRPGTTGRTPSITSEYAQKIGQSPSLWPTRPHT